MSLREFVAIDNLIQQIQRPISDGELWCRLAHASHCALLIAHYLWEFTLLATREIVAADNPLSFAEDAAE